jgi:hypothetical protein
MPGEWGCSGVSKPLDVSVSSTKDFSTTPTVIFDTPTLRLRLQSPGRSISVYSTGGLLVYLFESQSMIDYATLSLPPIAYGVYAVVVDGEWIGNFLNY